MRTSPFPRRTLRAIAMLAAGGALATSLVLAPTPAVAESVTSRTRTEPLLLRPTAADQATVARAAGDDQPTDGASTSSARVRRQRATTPFVAVGATVDAAPSGPVRMRTRGIGPWSPWFELHFDTGDAPDPDQEPTNPRLHSAPVWVGSGSTYEIDVPVELDRVDVHLVEEVRTTELTADAAGAAAAPAINPRSAWGARPPKSRPVTTQDLRAAVVHHSVTPNGYSQAEVPGILRSIQAYRQDAPGATSSPRWDFAAHTSTTLRTAARTGRPHVATSTGMGATTSSWPRPGRRPTWSGTRPPRAWSVRWCRSRGSTR